MKKAGNRRKHACCDATAKHRDYGRRTTPGAHEHSPNPGGMDHASGVGFWVNDPSATRAIKHRMTNMEWYLRNERPPFWGSPERPWKGLVAPS
jgi:hypothetical protein